MADLAPEPAAARRSASSAPLDPEEFARLWRASRRRLWGLAAGLCGSSHGADDLLQEACVVALQKLDQFEQGTRVDLWVAKIIRNLALNRGRKAQRRAEVLTAPEVLAESLVQPIEPAPTGSEMHPTGDLSHYEDAFDDELLHALTQLTPLARACLLLRVVEGLTYDQIAELTGVTPGTATSHVHRARIRLRESLRDDGSSAPEVCS